MVKAAPIQLEDSLVEDFIGLLAGQLQHFRASTPWELALINEASPPLVHQYASQDSYIGAHLTSERGNVGGKRLEGAEIFRRGSHRHSHAQAIAGAPEVARKRDVDCLRNVASEELRARPEAPCGEDNLTPFDDAARRLNAGDSSMLVGRET